ncbi:hypothetical protein BTO32_14900 [Marinobacter lutaoensis]|uniref:Uncharacterized protein n=2 Tax=Marinobacter lutaoensis TaxID=135739 RepID=A0A1V2DPP6_9GAMM|nr:hypothetical protein BTO32_14900 [Marinobacter lutaoensis]
MSWELIRTTPLKFWFNRRARRLWRAAQERKRRNMESAREAREIEKAKLIASVFGVEVIYHDPGMKLPGHVTPLQEAVRTLRRYGYLCLDRNGQIIGLDDRYIGQIVKNPVPKSELEAAFRRSRMVGINGRPDRSSDTDSFSDDRSRPTLKLVR